MNSLGLAHSKFILSGEHFVVDGAPAVVIPASCFSTQVSIQDKDTMGIDVRCTWDSDQPADASKQKAHEALVHELVVRAGEILQIATEESGILVKVRSSVPLGQGAGSSSSLCLAIVQALLKHFFADSFHPNYLDWFGTELENRWHGPVSGVDNAAIAYRCILKFQRGKSPEILHVPCPVFFVVGSTGNRGSVSPYAILHDLRDKSPLLYADFRRRMTVNANDLAESLESGDLISVGRCMDDSHGMFAEIGIVTPPMAEACRAAREAGAFGARMTGAGGGGFVIACAPARYTEGIISRWRALGLTSIRNVQFGLHTI